MRVACLHNFDECVFVAANPRETEPFWGQDATNVALDPHAFEIMWITYAHCSCRSLSGGHAAGGVLQIFSVEVLAVRTLRGDLRTGCKIKRS